MISQLQQKKLKRLLLYLKKNNIYYRKILSGVSREIIIDDVLSVYNEMKPITKKEIIENITDYVHSDLGYCLRTEKELMHDLNDITTISGNHDKVLISDNGKKWYVETTTGSTGKPFPVIKTFKERMVEATYLYKCRKHIYDNANISNGFLMIHQVDPILKEINYRDGTDKNFSFLLEHMLEKKPNWIFSTAILFKKFSNYIMSTDSSEVKNLNLKFIELTSQTLLSEEKVYIEDYFKTKVINNFGCREVWNIAYECPLGNLHVNEDYLIVNLIDENGNLISKSDTIGEVIITNLTNTTMPFVKYHIGDLARISRQQCQCGLASPVINFEEGRYYEKLINTNYYGNIIFRKILRTLYFHDHIYDINKIKIVQDASYHISVYTDKDKKEDELFERRFIELGKLSIENFAIFDIAFYYYYPFNDSEKLFKEQIFTNYMKEM